MRKFLLIISLVFCNVCCYAANDQKNSNLTTNNVQTSSTSANNQQTPVSIINNSQEEKQWSLLFYRGETSGTDFWGVAQFHYSGVGETMYSLELAYTLDKDNILNKYIYPYATWQVAANIAERFNEDDNKSTAEGDLYLVLRWLYFPWNKYITTTAAIGDGVSYTSNILKSEEDDPGLSDGTTPDDLQKALNFFLLEVTFALPSHPEFQLVTRLHHRCTLFGALADTKQGSTNVGIGIRYYF